VRLPSQASLVCPLTLGGHVDHRLTRAAAELLGRPLWYYADYPYVLGHPVETSGSLPQHVELGVYQLSADGLAAWGRSVAAHTSQISTFWSTLESMQYELQHYYDMHGGLRLWRPL
jgi:hypothetical protein